MKTHIRTNDAIWTLEPGYGGKVRLHVTQQGVCLMSDWIEPRQAKDVKTGLESMLAEITLPLLEPKIVIRRKSA